MNFNISNLISLLGKSKEFQNFKTQLLNSGADPKALLLQEIKKRGLTPEQIKNLLALAKQLNNKGFN